MVAVDWVGEGSIGGEKGQGGNVYGKVERGEQVQGAGRRWGGEGRGGIIVEGSRRVGATYLPASNTRFSGADSATDIEGSGSKVCSWLGGE